MQLDLPLPTQHRLPLEGPLECGRRVPAVKTAPTTRSKMLAGSGVAGAPTNTLPIVTGEPAGILEKNVEVPPDSSVEYVL